MDAVIIRFPLLLSGLGLTVSVALLSLILAIGLGLIGALAKLSPNRSAQTISRAYTTLIRGIPELVLMLFLVYGGQIMINAGLESLGLEPINIPPFLAGVLVIGFIYGAYMTETFRGAWLAIPKGQFEAGTALALSPLQRFSLIIWPQLMRHALPGLGNNWLVLVKATSLVSLIQLQDMVWAANVAGKATHQPFTFIFVVFLTYLAITYLSERVLNWLENRYQLAGDRG